MKTEVGFGSIFMFGHRTVLEIRSNLLKHVRHYEGNDFSAMEQY